MNSNQPKTTSSKFSGSRLCMFGLFCCIAISLFVWAYSGHAWLNESTADLASGMTLEGQSKDVADPVQASENHYRSNIGPIVFRYVMAVLFAAMAIGVLFGRPDPYPNVYESD